MNRKVLDALILATEAHGDQKHGTRPYVAHLMDTVRVLVQSGYECDTNILVAAALHDVLEDTDVEPMGIELGYGPRVREIVELVTDKPGSNRAERHAATYPAIAKNHEALAVKLADRIANTQACKKDGARAIFAMYESEYPAFQKYLGGDSVTRSHRSLWNQLDALYGLV